MSSSSPSSWPWEVDAVVAELVESEVLMPTEAKAMSKAAAKSKIGGPGGP